MSELPDDLTNRPEIKAANERLAKPYADAFPWTIINRVPSQESPDNVLPE